MCNKFSVLFLRDKILALRVFYNNLLIIAATSQRLIVEYG